MNAKSGYSAKTDNLTNALHYIPDDGRYHTFKQCWCHPVYQGDTVHHYPCKKNKARCES